MTDNQETRKPASDVDSSTTRRGSRLTTGAVIVLIGLVLLLDTTGVLPIGPLSRWIPGLFVLLGVWVLVKSGYRSVAGPLFVIVLAGLFQLQALGLLPDGSVGRWWPLAVVAFGTGFLVNRRQHRTPLTTNTDAADVVSVFGDARRHLTTQSFTGGNVVTVIGDADVDLRDAAVASKPATLDLVVVIGDCEVRVPEDWTVRLDTVTVLGEVVDRRPRGPAAETPDLVLTGLVVLGDVTVRD